MVNTNKKSTVETYTIKKRNTTTPLKIVIKPQENKRRQKNDKPKANPKQLIKWK